MAEQDDEWSQYAVKEPVKEAPKDEWSQYAVATEKAPMPNLSYKEDVPTDGVTKPFDIQMEDVSKGIGAKTDLGKQFVDVQPAPTYKDVPVEFTTDPTTFHPEKAQQEFLEEVSKPLPAYQQILASPYAALIGGVGHGVPKIAEGIEKMGYTIPNDKGFEERLTGALQVIEGAAHTGFGAANVLPPVAAFTMGLDATGKVVPEKYMNYIMAPFTSTIKPESELGQAAAGVGDIAATLLLFKSLHKLSQLPGEQATKIEDYADKMRKGEDLTVDQVNEVGEIVRNIPPQIKQEAAKDLVVETAHPEVAPLKKKEIELEYDYNNLVSIMGEEGAAAFAPELAKAKEAVAQQEANLAEMQKLKQADQVVTTDEGKSLVAQRQKQIQESIDKLNPKAISEAVKEEVKPVENATQEKQVESSVQGERESGSEGGKTDQTSGSDSVLGEAEGKVTPEEITPETPPALEEQPIKTTEDGKKEEAQGQEKDGVLTPESSFDKGVSSEAVTLKEAPLAEAKKIAEDHGYSHPTKMLNSIESNTGKRFVDVQSAVKDSDVQKFLEGKKEGVKPKRNPIVEKFAESITNNQLKEQLESDKQNGRTRTTDEVSKARERGIEQNGGMLEKLASEIDSKDYKALTDKLHLGNKNWRKFFEEYSGVKLGKTLRETTEALKKFTDYKEPEIVKTEKPPYDLSKLQNKTRYGDRLGVLTAQKFIETEVGNGYEPKKITSARYPKDKGSVRIAADKVDEYKAKGYSVKEQYILDKENGTSWVITKNEYEYAKSLEQPKGDVKLEAKAEKPSLAEIKSKVIEKAPEAKASAKKEGVSLKVQKEDLLGQIQKAIDTVVGERKEDYEKFKESLGLKGFTDEGTPQKLKDAGFEVDGNSVVFDIEGDGTFRLNIDGLDTAHAEVTKHWSINENPKPKVEGERKSLPKSKAIGDYSTLESIQRAKEDAISNLEEAKKSGKKELIDLYQKQAQLESDAYRSAKSSYEYKKERVAEIEQMIKDSKIEDTDDVKKILDLPKLKDEVAVIEGREPLNEKPDYDLAKKSYEKLLSDEEAKLKEKLDGLKKKDGTLKSNISSNDRAIISRRKVDIEVLKTELDNLKKEVKSAKESAAKTKIAEGVDGIINKIGAKKNLLPEEKTKLYDDIKGIVEGVVELGGITIKEAISHAVASIKNAEWYKSLTEKEKGEVDGIIEEVGKGMEKPKAESKTEGFEPEQGKKSLLNRVYEGTTPEEIKASVEKHGLTYEVESHAQAEKSANAFIDEVGIDNALKAVKNGELEGGAETFVWGAALDRVNREMLLEKDPIKRAELVLRESELGSDFDKWARSSGRKISALSTMYQTSDLGYRLGTILNRAKEAAKEGVVPEEVKAELTKLSEELNEANRKLAEAEKNKIENVEAKIAEEVDKVITKIHDRLPTARRQKADKAIAALEGIQKRLRAKAYDATIGVPVALIDAGISVIKQAIRAGVSIADAVELGIEHIKSKHGEWKKEDDFRKDILDEFKGEKIETKGSDKTSLDRYKESLRRSKLEYERKLREGDFTRNKNAPKPDLDAEAFDLLVERNKVKDKIDLEIEKLALENRPVSQKISEGFVDVVNLPKSLMASADLSAPLRQGAVLSAKHPIIASKAAKEMFKQAFSEEAHVNWLARLKSTPEYETMKRAGLYLAEPKARLAAKEEQFISNIAHKIPIWGRIVKGSERAYTGYLNKLRADVFAQFHDALVKDGFSGESLNKELKSFADFVNNASGRGGLGKFEEATPLLNSLFFSPRYAISRFNLLNPVKYANMTPRARAEALKTVGTYIGIGATVLALAKAGGASVTTDPRSADFGKIKVGNTRFDIWAGFQQWVRLISQVASGQKTTLDGKVKNLGEGYKADTRLDIAARFLRSKSSPSAGLVMDLMAGKDVGGNPVTFKFDDLKSFANTKEGQMIIPLWINDLRKVAEDEKSSAGLSAVAALSSFFGVGVQNYDSKKTPVTNK